MYVLNLGVTIVQITRSWRDYTWEAHFKITVSQFSKQKIRVNVNKYELL